MHSIIGWTGALLYLVSYFLLTIGKLKLDSRTYQLLNILGGICLIVNSTHQEDLPSVFVNAAWASIAILSIFIHRERRTARTGTN